MDENTPKAFVLLSKHHGSNKQLLALASELVDPGNVCAIHCELRTRRKLFYFIFKFLLWLKSKVSNEGLLSRAFKRLALSNSPSKITENDFIISKTPPFELPSLILKAGTGAKSIHIGSPKRMSRTAFDVLISSPSTPVENASIDLEILPTELTFEKFLAAKPSVNSDHPEYWLLLVGGNAKGYNYNDFDWSQVLEQMSLVTKAHSVDWLVVTSPRSSEDVKKILKHHVSSDKSVIKELVIWGENDQSISELIARSSAAVVTEDSASMLCDVLNTRMPLLALCPSDVKFNSLVTPLVEHHSDQKHLLRQSINNCCLDSFYQWSQDEFIPITKCWTDCVAEIRSEDMK